MGSYFNLREDERSFARAKEVYGLVIYDIVSHKRRVKLAHLLEGFGVRVQKSCFEVRISKPVYQKLRQHLSEFYQEDAGDQIRLYHIYPDGSLLFGDTFDVPKGENDIFL